MTDWQGQAELLKQQTLATLSDRDQQVRQLNAMLEEARASKLRHEHTQRQVKSYSLLFKKDIGSSLEMFYFQSIHLPLFL